MLRARGVFRYPMLDETGHPAMRLETGVGWRDTHFPGSVIYAQPLGGEQSTLCAAAATLDPHAIGYVQQMFADNQFFAAVATHLEDPRFRSTVGLLGIPDEYELLKAQPASPHRLPMSWSQPDFVFADEEDGVVAIRHGQEILYASLYWRARYGINKLARIHYVTPQYASVAVVRQETQFEPSGLTYKRPDWINMAFGNGGQRYPGGLHSAHAGELLPIARIPDGIPFKPGQENHFAGRGSFYQLRYGSYLIAMNMTKDRSFPLEVPSGLAQAPELVSGRTLTLRGPVSVPPKSTIILYVPN
jgi:hypothetical protein